MYDFTHCISDALEGITHSLCTLEFQDNRRLYDWVLDNISIPVHPRQYEFSRLNLEYTVMSKRKLNQLVTEKHVEGWDDPRMPTISGLPSSRLHRRIHPRVLQAHRRDQAGQHHRDGVAGVLHS
ncbi:glutaminyl-tRNA synthetase [Klebsiella pneumoniae]|uniref:Glutaminyl-tRNA synthetase n=1 Tax=Klebsiella pneumoniae TaxID=573 RepID=A0A4P0XYZ9_KLEPN|nr:glutaminyl-tRNA synthetase [Klebsiella pneumoniae]